MSHKRKGMLWLKRSFWKGERVAEQAMLRDPDELEVAAPRDPGGVFAGEPVPSPESSAEHRRYNGAPAIGSRAITGHGDHADGQGAVAIGDAVDIEPDISAARMNGSSRSARRGQA